jgi:hypothetical protein
MGAPSIGNSDTISSSARGTSSAYETKGSLGKGAGLTALRHGEDNRSPEEEADQQGKWPGEKTLADTHEESAIKIPVSILRCMVPCYDDR